jgi:hypothetical protein
MKGVRLELMAKKLTNKEVLGRTNGLLSFDMTLTAYKTTRTILLLLCAYSFPVGKCLQSRFLATIEWIHIQTYRATPLGLSKILGGGYIHRYQRDL